MIIGIVENILQDYMVFKSAIRELKKCYRREERV